jgi:hypothetical protein
MVAERGGDEITMRLLVSKWLVNIAQSYKFHGLAHGHRLRLSAKFK